MEVKQKVNKADSKKSAPHKKRKGMKEKKRFTHFLWEMTNIHFCP